MNRRNAIKTMGLAGAGLALATASGQAEASAPVVASASSAQSPLRVAHLTDMHIYEGKNAPKKLARTFHHLMNLGAKTDFILNGGDTILDAFAVKDLARNDEQWKLWSSIFNDECDLEIYHCIGNHDIWGEGPADHPLHGKAYAMEKMQLKSPYYSFDRGGWHFIVLDSVDFATPGCIGRLDEIQFAWLQVDLARTPATTPVIVTSHYPLLSATVFYPENVQENSRWEIPGAWIHVDFNRINDLFAQHRNVKVCLSGHMHQIDRVDYDGVTYFCNGAVCGSWWSDEPYYRSKAGYAVLNLFADGSFTRDFHHPAWI